MICISHLSKQYSRSEAFALEDISLDIHSGEFFGLLGPNGAGKTTLINTMATLLLPSSGEIRIDGEVLARNKGEVKRKLSFITQHYSLRNDMNCDEIIELQGRLYGMDRREIHSRADQLLRFCGMDEHRKKTVRKLSGGMKRKLMLCRALLTNPEILVLDEPTVGMDPASRHQIWDLLRELNLKGMTIVLTTHYIDEAQYLCGRMALIDHGRVARLDTPENMIRELGETAVDEFDERRTHSSFFFTREEALSYAETLEGRFTVRNTTLEDVFLHLVGRELVTE